MISTRTTARITSIFAAAALVAGAAAPVAAKSDPSSEAKAATDKASGDKRRFCVVTKITGSIIEKKECKTRAEWIAATGVDPARK
jgi:hypothetical protein